jgi:hypothetical protein
MVDDEINTSIEKNEEFKQKVKTSEVPKDPFDINDYNSLLWLGS